MPPFLSDDDSSLQPCLSVLCLSFGGILNNFKKGLFKTSYIHVSSKFAGINKNSLSLGAIRKTVQGKFKICTFFASSPRGKTSPIGQKEPILAVGLIAFSSSLLHSEFFF